MPGVNDQSCCPSLRGKPFKEHVRINDHPRRLSIRHGETIAPYVVS